MSTSATVGAVLTPATAQFLRAVAREDWTQAVEVLERHYAEVWFAISPEDLHAILHGVPEPLLDRLQDGGSLAQLVETRDGGHHGALGPLLPAAAVPGPARAHLELRLRERPVQALPYVRQELETYRTVRGALLDAADGEGAVWLAQAATTALLAGEVTLAQGMLLTALDVPSPARFPFARREVIAKRALALAVGGNVGEAEHAVEQGRRTPRTESWVETFVDRTLWLADFICAVDTLDPRAEEMRLTNPSPMAHPDLWPVALTIHVRHLVLTGRREHAEELCDAVSATGRPATDAEGLYASAVADARLAIRQDRRPLRTSDTDRASAAQRELAWAHHLFATGQFPSVTRMPFPATHNDRLVRAMAILRAQACLAKGRVREGRQLLLDAVRVVLQRRTYGVLSYLTADGLGAIGDTAEGARAAELVERLGLPLTEVRAVLAAPLTEAEIDVLHLLREGLTREEMAQRLFLSVNTIKTHLRAAYRKLGASHRVEALETFAQLGH